MLPFPADTWAPPFTQGTEGRVCDLQETGGNGTVNNGHFLPSPPPFPPIFPVLRGEKRRAVRFAVRGLLGSAVEDEGK